MGATIMRFGTLTCRLERLLKRMYNNSNGIGSGRGTRWAEGDFYYTASSKRAMKFYKQCSWHDCKESGRIQL